MAKKEEKPAAPAAESATPKKGLPKKTIAIVGIIMVVQAVLTFMIFGAMGPSKTHAAPDQEHLKHDDSDKTLEIQIVEDRFQNLQSGKVWVWEIGVFVQVKTKNKERVEGLLKQRNAEVKEGISQIIGRAQHAQLKEPDRQTLNRQFTAYLTKVLGSDDQETPLVERVLIPKCRGFPADF